MEAYGFKIDGEEIYIHIHVYIYIYIYTYIHTYTALFRCQINHSLLSVTRTLQ
jgi:hypothetical protein